MSGKHEGRIEMCGECSHEAIEHRAPLLKQPKIRVILFSAILLSIGLVLEFILFQILLSHIVYLIVIVLSGRDIVKAGLTRLIRERRLDMNFLMTVAAVGAFISGHAEEGASVMFLFFLAEFLESYSAERAKGSISALIRMAPDVARVRRNGTEVEVHVHEVGVGEIVLVRPGDRIPLDGRVLAGTSSVNQAPITGESMPVAKSDGDAVYAGTINQDGYLEISVTKKSDQMMLSKIVRLVEEAQRQKAPTERFIEKFSTYYTPTVISLAVATATIPPFLFGLPLTIWFYRALILLVVSCPCALAISTPVSMVSAITSGARNGVLIKSASAIEDVGKTRILVLDKTGTLTDGKPRVSDLISLSQMAKQQLLRIISSLESLSQHPLARAIVSDLEQDGGERVQVDNFISLPGKGVKGRINGAAYYLGSPSMFEELGLTIPKEATARMEAEGKTVVLVGDEKDVLGLVAVSDTLRQTATRTISELREAGVEPVMITGDNVATASAIAKRTGITHYHAQLLPEHKVEEIEALTTRYRKVAMVGDGVNDAPALAKASVGIAMGAIGSDVALETADIALMHDDISKLPYLVELSKKTMRVVKQNIAASILVKGSFAVLAFPGLVTLWLAVGIGDMGLSLAVILNAMRLALAKPS